MTDRTAIRTGLLLNAALFLVACVAVDLAPFHMGPGGFCGLAALGVSAMSYAAQEASEQAVKLVHGLYHDGKDERAAALSRSAGTLFTTGTALAIVSWALGLLAFVNLAVSAL